jgi:hypothetical protein
MAYATTAELAAFLAPTPAPSNGQRLLDRASRDIDSALKCAVYDVDADGNPTAPAIVTAFRDATLEQVAWRLATGEDEGLTGGYSSVEIGSVKLARGTGKTSTTPGAVGRLGEQARQILDSAGLLNFEPWAW